LTYGAIVKQLIDDYETIEEVNEQLEAMYVKSRKRIALTQLTHHHRGYGIGVRLIEDLLARSGISRCQSLQETAEVVAKVGFKMFLGVSATVKHVDMSKEEFSLTIEDNPLIDFVELPDKYKALQYSNILCGVLRGALEMVQMKVECRIVKCELKGDHSTEIRVKLIEILREEIPIGS